MDYTCKLLVKLYNVEFEGAWGRGDQFYKDIWLTNDKDGFKSLLSQEFGLAIGALEYHQFFQPCVVVYAKLEKLDIKGPDDAIAFLVSHLYLIQSFLDTLWVVKDHSVNFELGYLEVESKNEPSYTNSNLIGISHSLADGGIRNSKFSREEVRRARELFSKYFLPFCPPEDFRKSNPFLFRQQALDIASRKDSYRSQRFFFFINAARSQSDLGLKLAIFCTALEVLFSTDSSELTHKVAERVACFLGENIQERVSLFQLVKKAYGIRSRVIHGDVLSESAKIEISALCVAVDAILRRVALRLMETPHLHKVFENKIEVFFLQLVFSEPSSKLIEKILVELDEKPNP